MVCSASELASEVGVSILRQGGNAVDATVATGLALAVTYPQAGNLGGGGFLVLRLADGRATAIDFREIAPARAGRDLYLDAKGNVVPGLSTAGYLASGVPGTVAGLGFVLEHYGSGKLKWSDLVEPARRLAKEGFAVTPRLAESLRRSAHELGAWPESKRIFLRDGRFYAAGETLAQPELAATLVRLQESGPREFYTGETARLLAEDQAAHGGLISREDLAGYRVVERPILRGSYRGYEILTMPPPSSGGVALLQILGMVEPRDVAALPPNSPDKIHLFAEAMRRAFRDRAEFLGDPDFVKVPVAGLLERSYLERRFTSFNPARATPSERLPAGAPKGRESSETTHFSVVDAAGNAVSLTYTLNGVYGSGVTATGTGVLLNNEMDDFTSKVGVKNMFGLLQGEANAIAPGKRPLSSMTPTIVTREGKVFLVTGSPGGPTIITTTLQVISNVIDHSMSITEAVDAPRLHHQWQPDTIAAEPLLTSPDTFRILVEKGHLIGGQKLYSQDSEAAARRWGDAESILIDPATGHRLGANDLRNPDSGAAGY